MLIFPYSNKTLKVLLEICQLKLEFWGFFYMQILLHLTIQTLGKKKTCCQWYFYFYHNYDWIRELSIAAPADPWCTIRAIKSICFNFNIIKYIKNPQAALSFITTLIATKFLEVFVFHMVHLTEKPVSFKFLLDKQVPLE